MDRIRRIWNAFWLGSDRPSSLIKIGISRENLLHNLNAYRSAHPDQEFVPVLKSNAYGHGLILVAKLLDREPIAFFMVDSLFEARRLKDAGIRSRVLVMGYVRPEDIARNRLRGVDFAIVDIEQARELARTLRTPKRIHVKIDTGMHRHGILPEQMTDVIAVLRSNVNVQVVGLCSHFADADTAHSVHAAKQVERWKSASEVLVEAFPAIRYRHLAATKGVRFAKDAGTNVARLGIGLYGFDTAPGEGARLRPVLEMRTIVSSARTIPAGESVGYNATFTASEPMTLATIPAGYYEGIDRRLSGKGSVIIKGVRCPIVGRISMNMTSVDASLVPDVSPGDEVAVISRNPEDSNSIPEMVKLVNTDDYQESEYVMLAHLSPQLRRVVE